MSGCELGCGPQAGGAGGGRARAGVQVRQLVRGVGVQAGVWAPGRWSRGQGTGWGVGEAAGGGGRGASWGVSPRHVVRGLGRGCGAGTRLPPQQLRCEPDQGAS